MTELEREFELFMKSIYVRAKSEAGYNATIFVRMLGQKGGVETARYLLREPKVSKGVIALWERDCHDLTVEAEVLSHPEFWDFFEERDLDTARRWLRDFGYEPK